MGKIKFREINIYDDETDIGKAPRTLPGTHQVLCKFKLKNVGLQTRLWTPFCVVFIRCLGLPWWSSG